MTPWSPQYREDRATACRTLANLLKSERDPQKKDLLARDLVAKSAGTLGSVNDTLRAQLFASYETPGYRETDVTNTPTTPHLVDIVIMAVVNDELRALLNAFDVDEKKYVFGTHGRRYFSTAVMTPGRQGGRAIERRVVITSLLDATTTKAADSVANIRRRYDAATWFLVGMAAGNKSVFKAGDVAIPNSVLHYGPGRRTKEGFEPRPDPKELNESLQNNLRYYAPKYTEFYDRLAEKVALTDAKFLPAQMPEPWVPKVKGTNTIVYSGDSIIDNDELRSKDLRSIDERLTIADQESYGVALALRSRRLAILRGVADYGDGKKRDFKQWQYAATLAAALVLRDFLENEFDDPSAVEDDPEF